MNQNKSKIRVVYLLISVMAAVALGVGRNVWALSDEFFYVLLALLLLVIVTAPLIVNHLWYLRFMRSVEALRPILTEQHNPDRYIEENKKLLQGRKSLLIRATLRINLCAGYCEKGDYKEAKCQLQAVQGEKTFGIIRMIYLADYAYVCFYLGENLEALAAMERNRQGLNDFQDSEQYGGLISILRIFARLAVNERDKAKALYDTSRALWHNDRTSGDFDYLQGLLSGDDAK
ncbi:MAG: hypothetical protein RSG53_08195 [Oscillospiraceae bacterium]